MEDIIKQTNLMVEMSKENTKAGEEVKKVAEILRNISQKLNELLSKYKT